MTERMTIKEFVPALIQKAIEAVEKRGFILNTEDKESVSRMLMAHYSKYHRRQDTLDTFTTKEEPEKIIEQVLEGMIERGRLTIPVGFVKQEYFDKDHVLSRVGGNTVMLLADGILGGKLDDFSSIIEDMELILSYVEMRKLQESSTPLRPEDFQKLSAALTKTLIDVKDYFEKIKLRGVGHYL